MFASVAESAQTWLGQGTLDPGGNVTCAVHQLTASEVTNLFFVLSIGGQKCCRFGRKVWREELVIYCKTATGATG